MYYEYVYTNLIEVIDEVILEICSLNTLSLNVPLEVLEICYDYDEGEKVDEG